MNRSASLAETPTEAIQTFLVACIAMGDGATGTPIFADYAAEAHRRGMTAILDYMARNGIDVVQTAHGLIIDVVHDAPASA